MRTRSTLSLRLAFGLFSPLCIALGFNSPAQAQVLVAGPPTVGSSNPVSPEAPITRPSTTPCKVQLFNNQAFTTSANVPYTYTPPSACPGPWAKVVFTADFTIAAGTQLDRNAAVYLANATLFRGTTAEPRASLSPSWHVESDATGLSALFNTSQSGIAAVSTVINAANTSTIYANAELDFYSATAEYPAPAVADQVIPIVADSTNPVQSFTTASPLTLAITLPKNVTQLYMNLIAQPDELWWLSTPNAQVSPYINNVDATALRELDVTIDGTPAGIAPNHPYVFPGTLDPFLWEPIPGAQALNLKPYRINLTPFAGTLSDGNPHTIVVNDINTIGSATINADLLVFTDHGGATTTGNIVSNTLTASPGTSVASNVNLDGSGNGNAEVDESLTRTFTISGVTTSSAGKVTTTVAETVKFTNAQQLTNSATQNVVTENLTSTVDSTETTAAPTGTTAITYHTENPLQVSINTLKNTSGTSTKLTNAEVSDVNNVSGPGTFTSNAQEDIISTDQLALDSSGNITASSGQSSTGTYSANDSGGDTYSSTLNAANNVLTGVTTKSASSGSTLFLTASTTTANQGDPVTIVANIMPNNSTLTPTGDVTFYDNGRVFSVIGTSTGRATIVTTTLPAGTDVITASYTGDSNFIAENSINSVTINVAATTGTFTIGPFTPTTVTVSQGKAAVLSLPVTGNAIFNGTINFTCAGAPAATTCQVNPASVTLSVSSTPATETSTVSVVVSTTAPVTTVSAITMPTLAKSLGVVSIAGLFLLCLPKRLGKRWSALIMMAFLLFTLGSVAALSGCSGKALAPTTTTTGGGTPTGTYTLTVTGTSGSVSQSATFALTVTN